MLWGGHQAGHSFVPQPPCGKKMSLASIFQPLAVRATCVLFLAGEAMSSGVQLLVLGNLLWLSNTESE